MGVKQLWKLLAPAGRQISIETLEGRTLAVDVSIWLSSFLHGSRDRETGEMTPNAHIRGVLTRICTLLFYRIRPILVFDGGAPVLKRRTLQQRQQRTTMNEQRVKNAAKKLVTLQLQRLAVEHATGNRAAAAQPSGVSEGFVLADDDRRSAAPAVVHDSKSDEDEDEDENNEVEDEDEIGFDEADLVSPGGIDFEALQQLPKRVQHLVIKRLTDKNFQREPKRRQLMPLADDPKAFSLAQMSIFVKTSSEQQRLRDLREQLNRQEGEGQRIASSAGRHVVLREGPSAQPPALPTASASAAAEADDDSAVAFTDAQADEIIRTLRMVPVVPPDPVGDEFEEYDDVEADLDGPSAGGENAHGGVVVEEDQAGQGFKLRVFGISNQVRNLAALLASREEEEEEESLDASAAGDGGDEGGDDDDDDVEWDADPPPRESIDALIMGVAAESVSATEPANVSADKDQGHDLEWRGGNAPGARVDRNANANAHGQDNNGKRDAASLLEDTGDTIPPARVEHGAEKHGTQGVETTGPDSGGDGDSQGAYLDDENGERGAGLRPHASSGISVNSGVVSLQARSPEVIAAERVAADEDEVAGSAVHNDKDRRPAYPAQATHMHAAEGKDNGKVGHSKEHEHAHDKAEMNESRGATVVVAKECETDPDKLAHLEPIGPVPFSEQPSESLSSVSANDAEPLSDDNNDEIPPSILDPNALRAEQDRTLREKQKAERDAAFVTPEMVEDVKMLLDLFGLPYVESPMEAEAQCAELEQLGLVDGVVTDDCDAFLFGAKVVYKNIFKKKNHVEEFRGDAIAKELGVERDELVALALLLGSDYTEGIKHVGPVNALEVVLAFPGLQGLIEFREWVQNAALESAAAAAAVAGAPLPSSSARTSEVREKFLKKHAKMPKRITVPDTFPSQAVIDGYMKPETLGPGRLSERFTWREPDVDGIHSFLLSKLSWSSFEVDRVVKEPLRRAGERGQVQTRLDQYFVVQYDEDRRAAAIRSERVQNTVRDLRKVKKKSHAAKPLVVSKAGEVVPLPEASSGSESGSDSASGSLFASVSSAKAKRKPPRRRSEPAVSRRKKKVARKARASASSSLSLSSSSSSSSSASSSASGSRSASRRASQRRKLRRVVGVESDSDDVVEVINAIDNDGDAIPDSDSGEHDRGVYM